VTEGTLPGTNGNGVFDGHRSTRGAGGWNEELISPSGAESSAASPGGVSEDQLYSFWRARGDSGALGSDDLYLQLPDASARAACSSEPQSRFEYVGCGTEGLDPRAVGRYISPGGGHIIFTSREELEPQSPLQGTTAVYDRGLEGPARLVSLLPDGSVPSGPATYIGTSRDGTAVAFTVEENGTTTLYVRRNDSETLEIAGGETAFAGLSRDGSRIFYARRPFSPNEEPGGLFACDLNLGPCAGEDANSPIEIASDSMFVNVSEDGSRAYFTSNTNLYLWNAQTESSVQVAALDPSDVGGSFTDLSLSNWIAGLSAEATGVSWGPSRDPSRSTPDGAVLAFESHAPLTGYDSDGHSEIYRYDAETKTLTCLSCPLNATPAESDATLQDESKGSPIQSAQVLIANLSKDGSTAFFNTADSLVPVDVNGVQDVYEWHEGQLALISTGQSSQPSFLYAVGADGGNVFFTTRQALLPQDEDEGSVSIYDARVGGGFAAGEASGVCREGSCEGPASSPPSIDEPPTTTLNGPGNAVPRHVRCRKGKRVGKGSRTRCVRHHRKKHHTRNTHPHRRKSSR